MRISSRWMVALALLAVLPLGCGRRAAGPIDENKHIPRIQTIRPSVKALQVESLLTASIEPMERTDLMSRVAGHVPTLPPEIDIGKPITKGEILFRLHVPDLEKERDYRATLAEQAEAQYEQSQAAVKLAGKELQEARASLERYEAEYVYRQQRDERLRKLVASGSLQPETAEETQNQLRAAKAAWDAAKAQIETRQAKVDSAIVDVKVADGRRKVARADVERADVQLSYAIVRAPFNGIITRRLVNSGDTIKDASIPLLTVVRTDQIRVLIDIPERDVPLLRAEHEDRSPTGIGPNRVVLTIPALPGERFTGTITRMASALDSTTRTMRAEMHLERKEGLKPGMYGRATVYLAAHDDRLTIPSSALVRRGDDVEVFYVELTDANHKPPIGRLRRIRVDLGLDDGQEVEIRSKTLTKDMLVVVKGNSALREDDTVMAILARPAAR